MAFSLEFTTKTLKRRKFKVYFTVERKYNTHLQKTLWNFVNKHGKKPSAFWILVTLNSDLEGACEKSGDLMNRLLKVVSFL